MLRTLLRGTALLLGVIGLLIACEEAATPGNAPPGRDDLNGTWLVEEYVVSGWPNNQPSIDLSFRSFITMSISLDARDRDLGRIDTNYSPAVNGVRGQREQIYFRHESGFDLHVTAVDLESEDANLEAELLMFRSRGQYSLIDKDTLHLRVLWELWVGDGQAYGMTNTIKARRL